MPDNAPRPWKMFLPFLIVLGLSALWSIYWFVASAMIGERFAREREALESQGVTLSCTEEGWGGFPFRFEFNCSSPILLAEGKAEARSGNLLIVSLAYAPWQAVVLVDGPTTVSAQGLSPAVVEHQRAIAAITFGRDGGSNVSAEIPAVSVAGLGSAAKLMAHSRPSGGGTDIALSMTDAIWQEMNGPALPIARSDLLGTWTEERTLKLDRIEFQQGEVRYWGSGTIGLDEHRRLAGRLDTETNDLDGLLALLEPHLQLSDAEKANLRTMLRLLGNATKAPLIARDGVLYIGPFRLADLMPLY